MNVEDTSTTQNEKPVPRQPASAEATKARPTDRDRQLIGLLAIARYLSTEQLCRLFYAGRNAHNMRKRLLRFAGESAPAFKPACVRRLFFRTYAGHRSEIWTLTSAGYGLASTILDTIIKTPKHDVGAAFREHTIMLNELFVALMMPTGRGYARAKQNDFRWIPSDTVRLPWRQHLGDGSRSPDRLVLPDAVLEIPNAQRRYFLECETGTHPILGEADPRPGSTIAKVQNYEGFLRSYVDASATQTFYARSFPDNYLPEVLFLVRGPHRTTAVNQAIQQWRKRCATQSCASRALTVEDAQDELLAIVRSRSNPKGNHRPPAAEGRLSIDEVATVRRFYNGTVLAFKEMRAKARARKEVPPAYPPMVEEMQALLERLQAAAGT
jgi:hypothetical protein